MTHNAAVCFLVLDQKISKVDFLKTRTELGQSRVYTDAV